MGTGEQLFADTAGTYATESGSPGCSNDDQLSVLFLGDLPQSAGRRDRVSYANAWLAAISEQVLDMRKSGVREGPHQVVVLGLEKVLCSFAGLVVDQHEPSSERSGEELSKGKCVRGALGFLDTHDDRPGGIGSQGWLGWRCLGEARVRNMGSGMSLGDQRARRACLTDALSPVHELIPTGDCAGWRG
jgi:hypothetical protein